MKVVVSSKGENLDAPFSRQFGRCPMFVVVETASMEFEAAVNPSADASSGAGIQAAQFVVESGAEAVICGRVGPNAMNVLRSAGLPVYQFGGGTIRQALEELRAGDLGLLTGKETRAPGAAAKSLDENPDGRRAKQGSSPGEGEAR